jgi:hypothetical protein
MVQASNISIDGTIIRKKVLQITAYLEDSFTVSKGWLNKYKRRHNIVYTTLAGESKSVHSETVDDWKNDRFLQDIKEYNLCDT